MILLFFACADEASLYREALAAPDWDTARRTCERLDVSLAGDCLVTAMGRFARLDAADCDAVGTPLWHEECLFQYAERAAQAGQLDAAFRACTTSAYGRECSFHLIRQATTRMLASSPAEAATAIDPYLTLEPAPDAARLFWRTWFRDRAAAGTPVDPTGCPDDACRHGAEEAIYTTLNGLAMARGATFCTVPPTSPAWAAGPLTDAWVSTWWTSECRRRAGLGPAAHAP